MQTPNEIDLWLNSVAYEHSQSKATHEQYKRVFKEYTNTIGMTPKQIITDYENADRNNISERTIKRKHAKLIQHYIMTLQNRGLTTTSIKVMIGAVASYYKYNDLSLGHIPQPRTGIVYHNKDITKDEINLIMANSNIREKAFFATMTQSGLRPHTIKQLKIKHIEKILEENTPIPCKITVPKEIEKGQYGNGHPSFIGEEATKHIKAYLATKTNLTPDSLLFSAHNNQKTPINTKNMSRAFRETAKKLNETGAIEYKIRKGKPSELRLYNLRKYFRKMANQMGFEHVNYLMNHTTRGSDSNYTPKDDKWYRELYEEKAMPHLQLDTATPTETTQIIKTLKEQHKKEIEKIKEETDLKIAKQLAEYFKQYKQLKKEEVKDAIIKLIDEKNPIIIQALKEINKTGNHK